MTITIRKEEKEILLHTPIHYRELERLVNFVSDGNPDGWVVIADALLPDDLLEPNIMDQESIPQTTPNNPWIYPTPFDPINPYTPQPQIYPTYPDPNNPWIITCKDNVTNIKTNFGDIAIKDARIGDITFMSSDENLIPNVKNENNSSFLTFDKVIK